MDLMRNCWGWLVVITLGFSAATNASLQDAPFTLEEYPGASLVATENSVNNDYLLTLGALKKINNRWRAEQEERLQGELNRTTWELPRGHTADEGFEHYLKQLQRLRFEELFSCRARACGSSNSWANNRFGVKLLYGLDRFQRYGAYRLIAGQRAYYVSLYSVTRGNKRAYVHREVLATRIETDTQQKDVNWDTQWRTQGYISLPLASLDPQQLQTPASLAEFLQSLPSQTLAVVGHDFKGDSQSQQQERSLGYAEAIISQIQQAGVDKHQLQAYGLGGLAPVGRSAAVVRVDLVPIR